MLRIDVDVDQASDPDVEFLWATNTRDRNVEILRRLIHACNGPIPVLSEFPYVVSELIYEYLGLELDVSRFEGAAGARRRFPVGVAAVSPAADAGILRQVKHINAEIFNEAMKKTTVAITWNEVQRIEINQSFAEAWAKARHQPVAMLSTSEDYDAEVFTKDLPIIWTNETTAGCCRGLVAGTLFHLWEGETDDIKEGDLLEYEGFLEPDFFNVMAARAFNKTSTYGPHFFFIKFQSADVLSDAFVGRAWKNKRLRDDGSVLVRLEGPFHFQTFFAMEADLASFVQKTVEHVILVPRKDGGLSPDQFAAACRLVGANPPSMSVALPRHVRPKIVNFETVL